MKRVLAPLLERIKSFWDLEDPEERIEGSGTVYLDPAYNGQYQAERELEKQAQLAAEVDAEAHEQIEHGGAGQFGHHESRR